jgi:hypothetical protein
MERENASDGTPPDYEAPVVQELDAPAGPSVTAAGLPSQFQEVPK